jgi:hypothetical protein
MLHKGLAKSIPANRRGPIVAESRVWVLVIRGGHLKVTSHEIDAGERPGGKRGVIRGFSVSSRMRMLQLIDEIDWLANGPGVFMTLTLPDQCWERWQDRLTMLRQWFWRDSEKHLGKKICALWRIEWMPRKTGAAVGQLRPHWHFLMPGLRWYDQQDAMEIWKRILKVKRRISVEAERMDSKRKIAVYIAKYCAKETDPSHLDCVAYLNKHGRHWGIRRKDLITMHEPRSYEDIPLDAVHEIRKVREAYGRGYSSLYDAGFSLYGPWSDALKETIEQIALDNGCAVSYKE